MDIICKQWYVYYQGPGSDIYKGSMAAGLTLSSRSPSWLDLCRLGQWIWKFSRNYPTDSSYRELAMVWGNILVTSAWLSSFNYIILYQLNIVPMILCTKRAVKCRLKLITPTPTPPPPPKMSSCTWLKRIRVSQTADLGGGWEIEVLECQPHWTSGPTSHRRCTGPRQGTRWCGGPGSRLPHHRRT